MTSGPTRREFVQGSAAVLGSSLLGRHADGVLASFQEGAAYIAIRAGVPLVPIALNGTREVLPYGSGHVRSGSVTMRIGDPIPTDQLQLRDRGQVTDQLRERISSMLNEQAIHV